MATTDAKPDAKPGFRLPWTAERGATSSPTSAEDAAAADADAQPVTAQEDHTPAMIDAPAPTDPAAVDREAGSATATAPAAAPAHAPAPAPARKPNKLMADLTKAMQAAAENARTDVLSRLGSDAKAFIESIHADSATEATELRRQADDDVASIREWSKAEIARIREETETRIGDRKGRLEREIEDHAGAIERRIERVQARVAAFEAEMADFFERVSAEVDPTRLAAMAESLPEAPTFEAGLGTDADDWTPPSATVAAAPETEVPAAAPEAEADVVAAPSAGDPAADPRVAVLGLTPDFAAAEAEAAAFGDLEGESDEEIPIIADDALAARLAGLVPDADSDPAASSTTRVVVVGLVSVASIAGFKRNLSRVPGVDNVGVSSGPDGEFVFAVAHGGDLDLGKAVSALPGFAARVTAETDGELHVAARDPEADS